MTFKHKRLHQIKLGKAIIEPCSDFRIIWPVNNKHNNQVKQTNINNPMQLRRSVNIVWSMCINREDEYYQNTNKRISKLWCTKGHNFRAMPTQEEIQTPALENKKQNEEEMATRLHSRSKRWFVMDRTATVE